MKGKLLNVILLFVAFLLILCCNETKTSKPEDDDDSDEYDKITSNEFPPSYPISSESSEESNEYFVQTSTTKPIKESKRRQLSLTFVFDTTGSMMKDLKALTKGATDILETIVNRTTSPISNFVLIPYGDPDIGNVTSTTDAQEFLQVLKNISIAGGGDCPEMALTGIREALKYSLPYSYIYVITDASPKDRYVLEPVLKLIQLKRSQVVFLTTGRCRGTNETNEDYYKIAEASSGQVFDLNKDTLKQILDYVKDTLDNDLINLESFVQTDGYDHKHNVTVDKSLKKITVSLAGKEPKLSVVNPSGESVEGPPKLIESLSLNNTLIINIVDPEPGNWLLTLGAKGNHSVKVTGVSQIKFDYGFFVIDTDKIQDTTLYPLLGVDNQLMIDVTHGAEDISILNYVEILDSLGQIIVEIPLKTVKNSPNMYKTIPFLPIEELFYFAVKGLDIEGNKIRRLSSSGIQANWMEEPIVTVEDTIVAELHSNVTLKCKVDSLVSSTAFWVKSNKILQEKKKFHQSGVIEYEIIDVVNNSEGIYVCNAKNEVGKSIGKTELVVTGPLPNVTLFVSNSNVEVNNEFELTCMAESELIIINSNLYVKKINGRNVNDVLNPTQQKSVSLFKKQFSSIISVDTPGDVTYACECSNKMGTTISEAHVKILPQIIVTLSPYSLREYQRHEDVSVNCTIHGTRLGKWMRIYDNEVSELDGNTRYVEIPSNNEENTILRLNILDASSVDEGTYICTGYRDNNLKSVKKQFTLVYVEKPKILENSTRILQNIKDNNYNLIFNYTFTGIPEPFLSWILPNGIILNNNSPIYGDIKMDNSQLYFTKLNISDEGLYKFRVENQYGSDEKSIELSVYRPLSFDCHFKNFTIHNSASLKCNADSYPKPKLTWYHDDFEFFEFENRTELYIERVTWSNRGLYKCLAKYPYGELNYTAYLNVMGNKPQLSMLPSNIKIKPQKDFFVECSVISDLPIESVEIYFYKDWGNDKIILPTTSIVSEDIVKYRTVDFTASSHFSGLYICKSTNFAGTAQKQTNIEVLPLMIIESLSKSMEYEQGSVIRVFCNVSGAETIFWDIPNSEILFSRDFETIRSDEDLKWLKSTLIIENATEINEGNYKCIGRRDIDGKELVSGFLGLKYVEKPKIFDMIDILNIEMGEKIIFVCNVSGKPYPTVRWILPDENSQLEPDDNRLIIINASLNDAGKYTCRAENHLGIAESVTILTVWSKPFITDYTKNVSVELYNDLNLTCPMNGYPYPQITWNVNGKTYKEKTIILTNVTIENGGKYICIGENVHGNVSYDLHVDITGTVQPYFDKTNITMKLMQGQSVTLECKSQGLPIPSEHWNFNGKSSENDDFRILESAKGILELENVKIDNSGVYTCIAENSEGIAFKSFNIVVYEEATILENGLLPTIELLSGTDEITIPCNVLGYPLPNISWSYNGNHIVNDVHYEVRENQTLVIRDLTKKLSGEYRCRAENYKELEKNNLPFKREYDEIIYDIEIINPPEVIGSDLKNITVIEGSKVTLECPIKIFKDKFKIIWFNDTESLDNNESTLSFVNISRNIAGTYSCLASNTLGSSIIKSYRITVNWPPVVIGNQQEYFNLIESDDINLTCEIDAKPKAEIQWIKDLNIIGNNSVLEINNIKEEHHGKYICNALNTIGYAEKLFFIKVTTIPKIIGPKWADLEVLIGDPVELDCSVISGKPIDQIVWNRIGFDWIQFVEKLISNNISKSSEGLYVCEVTNNIGKSTKQFNLTVLEPSQILYIEIYENNFKSTYNKTEEIFINKTNSVMLSCITHGNPISNIHWLKNDMIINSTDLILNNFTQKDAGNYTCVASNKINTDTRDIKINIAVPPYYETNYEVFSIIRGSSINLICDGKGSPEPINQWYFDGGKLIKNQSSIILYEGQLQLLNIEHSGNFTCVSKNTAGTSNKIFNIVTYEEATIIESGLPPTIELLNGLNKFTIPCVVKGYPFPKITWMYNGNDIIDGFHYKIETDGSLLIELITETLTGKYTCRATNSDEFRKSNLTITKEFDEVNYYIKITAPPEIIGVDNKRVVVIEGSNVTLECPVKTSTNQLNIEWFKDTEPLIEAKNEIIISLTNVTRKDVSNYSCTASNTMGNAMMNYSIVVNWKPIIIDENITETIQLSENDSISLKCSVDANPEADIRWMKDSHMIGVTSSVLKKDNIKIHHSGTHTCIASNRIGHSKKKFIIHVSRKPTIEGPEFSEVEVELGLSTELECIANGIPRPDIKWAIKYDPDWLLEDEGQVLKSLNVSKASEGLYTCEANNTGGLIKKYFNLTVLEKPHIIAVNMIDENNEIHENSYEVSLREGSSAVLSCTSQGYPLPVVHWIKNGLYLNETLLTFTNISRKDTGTYTCIAFNKIGEDEKDVDITVQVLPYIKHDQNVTKVIKTRENHVVELNCQIGGNPSPEVNWYKDDTRMIFDDSIIITKDNNRRLNIKRISRNHTGVYKCVAKNILGEISKTFEVEVLVPPYSDRVDNNSSLVTNSGQDFNLECPVRGNPKPMIRWLKSPAFEITESPHTKIQLDKNISTLIIKNSSMSDSGNYSCILVNEIGSIELFYSVEVIEVPRIIFEIDENVAVNSDGEIFVKYRRSIQIICKATGYPEPIITWFKNREFINDIERESLQISLDRQYLTIMDTMVEDSGEYTCFAENTAGIDRHNFVIHVIVPVNWSPWSKWSKCNVTCGMGYSTRERQCLEETYTNRFRRYIIEENDEEFNATCRGDSVEYRECLIRNCEVDGGWSDWSAWEECSKNDNRRRFRKCDNPEPKYGGKNCSGGNVETGKCNQEDEFKPHKVMEIPLDPEISNSLENITDLNLNEIKFECEPGYKYNSESIQCEDIDECHHSNYHGCHTEKVCKNTPGGYECLCDSGYTTLAKGSDCLDINECNQKQIHGCSHNCENTPGSFRCYCPSDLVLFEDLKTCGVVEFEDNAVIDILPKLH